MHGGTKCMVVQNAWWYEMHGGTKCMVVQNAWWYKMHGGTKCMVVLNVQRLLQYTLLYTLYTLWGWYRGIRHVQKTNNFKIADGL
jgi:hypothetical protein